MTLIRGRDLAGISQEDWVAQQWKQAKGTQPTLMCGCGELIPIRFMYRCLYCQEYFCMRCAEQHFGKTRADYLAEREKRNGQDTTAP